MKKLIVLLLTAIVSCPAFAEKVNDGIKTYIVSYKPYNAFMTVQYEPAFANSQGCTHNTSDWNGVIRWNGRRALPDTAAKIFSSTAVLARTNHIPVSIDLSGCDATGIPRIHAIGMDTAEDAQ